MRGKTDSNTDELDVTVKVDAVKVAASEFWKEGFNCLDGYRRAYDYRIPGTGKDKAYNRVCQYVQLKTGLKVGVSYDPANGWMPNCMATISPPDKTGMKRATLEEILELLPHNRFLKVELAHDFCSDSIVDADFIRRHLVVGKSRRKDDPRQSEVLYFGARLSPVFARCYYKEAIDCYRVELEFHSEWLKKNHIATTDDFVKLPDLVARSHIAFFKIDPLKLSAALLRLGAPVTSTMRKVISRKDDLSVALRYLRKIGLTNSVRVLTPLKTNSRVEKALRQWAQDWQEQGQRDDEVA
jgi:hypothetical protein